MPQSKSTAPSVLEVIKSVKKGKLLPVYYLFGDDTFNLDYTVDAITEAVNPLILSDFDKEICYSEDRNLQDVLNAASAFPFGSKKKLIIYKEAEKAKDKKLLEGYISSPTEFTVLVFVHNGKITNLTSSPFNLLLKNNFIFEAKELRGDYLVDWTINWINSKGKNISNDNAIFLTEICGENRLIIESQVEKILAYLSDKSEITFDIIQKVTSDSEQYNIFDLQEAIFKKDTAKALKIAFNMIDKGENAVLIVSMLTKAFIALSQVKELKDKNTPDTEIAKIAGVPYFTVKNFKIASTLFSQGELEKTAEALLKADVSIKTTSIDQKSIIALLIAEII